VARFHKHQVSLCILVLPLIFPSAVIAQAQNSDTPTAEIAADNPVENPNETGVDSKSEGTNESSPAAHSKYHLVLGSGHTLLPDGSFSSGIHASIYSSTIYQAKDVWLLSNYIGDDSDRTIEGSIELTFIELNDLEEAATQTVEQNRNPFTSGKGILKFSASIDPGYLSNNGTEGLGTRLGVGFTTRPNDTATDVDTASRVFGGVVFRAIYGENATTNSGVGEVFLGLSHDRFWRFSEKGTGADAIERTINEKNRFIVDGRMDLPGILNSDQVRIHARVFADLPLSGKGPSDIRLSLLLTFSIDKLLGLN